MFSGTHSTCRHLIFDVMTNRARLGSARHVFRRRSRWRFRCRPEQLEQLECTSRSVVYYMYTPMDVPPVAGSSRTEQYSMSTGNIAETVNQDSQVTESILLTSTSI